MTPTPAQAKPAGQTTGRLEDQNIFDFFLSFGSGTFPFSKLPESGEDNLADPSAGSKQPAKRL